MSDLAEFLTRFADAKGERPPPEDSITEEGLERAGALALPFYRRVADRADVDLDQLHELTLEGAETVARISLARLVAGRPILAELQYLVAAMQSEGFLAGALWEQERHLPDLDLETPPS
jgi:hypothetical protein